MKRLEKRPLRWSNLNSSLFTDMEPGRRKVAGNTEPPLQILECLNCSSKHLDCVGASIEGASTRHGLRKGFMRILHVLHHRAASCEDCDEVSSYDINCLSQSRVNNKKELLVPSRNNVIVFEVGLAGPISTENLAQTK
jgi:hypothetical protein